MPCLIPPLVLTSVSLALISKVFLLLYICLSFIVLVSSWQKQHPNLEARGIYQKTWTPWLIHPLVASLQKQYSIFDARTWYFGYYDTKYLYLHSFVLIFNVFLFLIFACPIIYMFLTQFPNCLSWSFITVHYQF